MRVRRTTVNNSKTTRASTAEAMIARSSLSQSEGGIAEFCPSRYGGVMRKLRSSGEWVAAEASGPDSSCVHCCSGSCVAV